MTLESQYELYKEVFPESTYSFGQWKTIVVSYTLEQFLDERFKPKKDVVHHEYYTPDIEDIFIGYNCQATNDNKHWYDWTFQESSFSVLKLELLNNIYRTKYLDKEDIELEGWIKITSALDRYPNAWEKENHILVFYPTKDNQIEIVMKDVTKDDYLENTSNGRGFAGKCKSINELRTIQKLLNIK